MPDYKQDFYLDKKLFIFCKSDHYFTCVWQLKSHGKEHLSVPVQSRDVQTDIRAPAHATMHLHDRAVLITH